MSAMRGAGYLVLLLAGPAAAQPAADPSVLVQTAPPHQGTLPRTVTVYGTVAPAPHASLTLSLPRDGQVAALFVVPGSAVRTGDRLLDFTPSPTAVSTFQQAVSALEVARSERAHTADLLTQRLATRDQLARADKAVSDAQASLAALQRDGGGPGPQAVVAPFDGIVTAVPVTPGDRLAAGLPLLTLAQADGLVVNAGVEPADRASVQPGQSAQLAPLDSGAPVAGQVVRVSAMLNLTTHLVDLTLSVPAGGLLPWQGIQARVTTGDYRGWILPQDAVLTDANGSYLFQVASNKAVRVGVSILGHVDGQVIVEGPVEPSRPWVVVGNYQLTDGMGVRIAPATTP